MPLRERTANQMRKEFVERVLAQEKTKSALCAEYGISRPTGDEWIRRYQEGTLLDIRSRRPLTMPTQTPDSVEQLILSYRTEHPAIGAVKIRKILQDQGYQDIPCAKTVNNILKRHGMITREASLAATPTQRFEKAEPNEMWQADYKGHFPLQNGVRCHPLNILDDCTRFNLCCEALLTETFEDIRPVMIRLFTEYGMPRTFLCDNGNPWGTQQSTGYSKFEVWLMELGILTIHGRARHPQTQGKDESFNRSFTRELLKCTTIADMNDAQKQFDTYRHFYNTERPHHALNLDTPASRYHRSSAEYTDTIAKWEYPEGTQIRKVKETGYVTWENSGFYLSEAFGNKEIAIQKSHTENCINLYFRQFRIGKFDTDKRVFLYKKAYLIKDDPRMQKTPNE